MRLGLHNLLTQRLFGQHRNCDHGLVRMFEIEYNNEYRNAVKAGVNIDRQFVESFLKTMN